VGIRNLILHLVNLLILRPLCSGLAEMNPKNSVKPILLKVGLEIKPYEAPWV